MNVIKAIGILAQLMREREWGDELDSKDMFKLKEIKDWCDKH